MGREYKLTGTLIRADEPEDGTQIEYHVKENGTETWSLTEGSGTTTLEMEYDDHKPVNINLYRGNKNIQIDYVSLCDIVNLMNGIDIMKAHRKQVKLVQPVTVQDINYSSSEVEELKDKIGTLSDEKIQQIIAIANSEK